MKAPKLAEMGVIENIASVPACISVFLHIESGGTAAKNGVAPSLTNLSSN